jgi:FkbM family methyltransferase
MLCFDIGANIGKWTIANKDKYDKIVSIEAAPIVYDKLLINTSELKNCKCLNYAVSNNNNEDITFYFSNTDTISSLNPDWYSNKSRFSNTPYTPIICKSITLDKLIEEYGTPDLIKIDVECGEYSVISSLSKKTPLICFEWAAEMNNIYIDCLEHLRMLGYNEFFVQYEDEYTFTPSKFNTLNEVKEELSKTIDRLDWGMIWAK